MFFRSRVLESTRCYSYGRCAFAWSQAEKQSTTEDNGAFLPLLSFNIFHFEHSHVHVSFLSSAFPLLLFEASLQAEPFLIRAKRETSLHYDLLSQTAFARNPIIQGNSGKHCLCHYYQGNKKQSPAATGKTATQIKLHFPPHTLKRRTFLKILMPEPNFLPAGRFYKAMKLPRSLKLLLCTNYLHSFQLWYCSDSYTAAYFTYTHTNQDRNQASPLEESTCTNHTYFWPGKWHFIFSTLLLYSLPPVKLNMLAQM